MENKKPNKPFNYLPVALLMSLAIVVGVSFSSIRSGGETSVFTFTPPTGQLYNCDQLTSKVNSKVTLTADEQSYYDKNCTQTPPQNPAQGTCNPLTGANCTPSPQPTPPPTSPQYTCDQATKDITSGNYSMDEKSWYLQNCPQTTPTPPPATTYTCDQALKDITGGNYNADEKDWYGQNCPQTNPTAPQYNCDKLSGMINSNVALTPDQKDWYNKNCKPTPAPQPPPCQPGVASTAAAPCTPNQEQTPSPCTPGVTAAANCKPDCASLKDKAASGDETAMAQYKKYCSQATDDPCAYLKGIIDKYNSDPKSVTADTYNAAKKKYALYCSGNQPSGTQPTSNGCDDLRAQLDLMIKNGQTDTNDYTETKLKFTALCTEATPPSDRCSQLKTKLETYIQNGDTGSADYASVKEEYLKSCQKALAPAGYNDPAMTSFDQKDCPFSDSNVNELCGKAAMELYRRGVIGGYSDGTFKGKNPVSRAQAAKLLMLAKFGVVSDDSGSAGISFTDVPHGSWFEKFVIKAAELGVIKGFPDGTFRPANGVTVAEFLKMLTVAFDLETGLPFSYSDVHATDWFAQYAGTAEKYNLFPNNPKGLLNPFHKLTRCEAAIAIYEYLLNRSA